VAAVLLLAGGGAWLATRGDDEPAATAPTAASAAPQGTPAERARAAVAAALPGIGCSWLDLTGAGGGAGGTTLRLTGVAGQPAEAQAAIMRTAAGSGAPVESADFSDVAPITASECGSVDAFRAIRATGATRLTVPQRTFEMAKLPAQSAYPGQLGARTIINLDTAGVGDFALYGIEPSGEISAIVNNRRHFATIPKTGDQITDLGKGRYRFAPDVNHMGWSGILLLTGKGGFSPGLVEGPARSRGADWPQRFAAAARAGGWRSEMVWFKMVDERPN
jgi:serine/threonine-protein kinase